MGLDAVVVVEQDALLPLDAPLGVLEPEPGVAQLIFQSPCKHPFPSVSTAAAAKIVTGLSEVVQGTGQAQIAADSYELGAKGSEQKHTHKIYTVVRRGPYPWNQAV